ncbi:MAG: hypothetical protein PSV13_19835 [Lacunisphaera sp.]|nr:hypothetical protein [Lacunisphaera sp.]
MKTTTQDHETRERAKPIKAGAASELHRQAAAAKDYRRQKQVATQVRRYGQVYLHDDFSGQPTMFLLQQGVGVTVLLHVRERRALLVLVKYYGYQLELPDYSRPYENVLLWQEYYSERTAAIELGSLRQACGVPPKGVAS